MPVIEHLLALEVLDSRGKPTVQCTCRLSSGTEATISVPSGASTGTSEAMELRDGDLKRYRGNGCLKAVENINKTIEDHLHNRSFDQSSLDKSLVELDGTDNKTRLGANAILAVSLAFAKATSIEAQIPLYTYFHQLNPLNLGSIPRPMINLFSGGKHAGHQVSIQDVQIMPVNTHNLSELFEMVYETYYTAVDMIKDQFKVRHLTADEGGLAPNFSSDEAMLDFAVRAIEAAGFRAGDEIVLTLDVAASHFFRSGNYTMSGETLSGQEMTAKIADWIDKYPIASVEDGLAEDDWHHWSKLTEVVPSSVLILGDDLLCTNPKRIQRAIDKKAANSLLLKVNQIGTLSEAIDAYNLAHEAGWKIVVSARSGETEDHWLADLAVGLGSDYIKVGALNQSERLAKYNRLLSIAQETGWTLRSQR